ncbi:TPA: hypothetical protein PXN44_004393 [Yersinia enterocolitica]|nr:hypothetical protein [Yersinia enterocolitica]
MLVRIANDWEQGMTITYADIKQQKIKLDEGRQARRVKLQRDVGNLMNAYRDSLSLEYPQWFDKGDVARPYVTVGFFNDNKRYEKTSIASLQLDKEHKISFLISTVVDDSPTKGDHYIISVSLYYNAGVLIAEIGDGQCNISVANPDAEDGFTEVIEEIKQLIITGLTDHSLD